VLSQVTPDIVASLVSSLGVVGALVWYLYYNTSVTIPNLTKEHTTAIQNIANSFTASLKEERETRRVELKELHESLTAERLCKWKDK
jgi:low affinity Fe/Cu permease